MVDLDVLEKMGSTQERLREVFTAKAPSGDERAKMSEEEIKKREKDVELRCKFEDDISQRLSQQISYSLANSQIYGAVDMAWDSAPINKETYPLLLYAQGKLDMGTCAKQLKNIPGSDKYTTKDARGTIVSIDLPKFFEVNFNLVRSVISRRLAAQANKYLALYPYYKYEARSTSQVGKLRADILSQVMDIMVDQFDARHHEIDVMRDAMLYGHCVDFVRSRWEREEQTIFDPDQNPELTAENPKLKAVITKEGVGFTNPHPTRVFWDNACPMSTINADIGPGFIGFWDVIRYGDVAKNPKYWNRSLISYSSTSAQLFYTYAQYFSQYYCNIKPPCEQSTLDLAAANDRLNQLGVYSESMADSSLIIAEDFKKIIPKDWGIGDYPHAAWLRMRVAGDKTVVYAEFLPSTPACYCGINERDNRQLNISIAMEILPYQDQMTQLLSFLLLVLQGDFQRVMLVDISVAKPEMIAEFRKDVQGKNKYNATKVFEYDGAKMRELGLDPRKVIDIVQTQPSQAITMVFQAMTTLVQLAERLMALSPHELGQPAPREISATETTMIAGTTETIYGFISDAFDEYRAAKKRVLYESYMVCGSQNFRVPATNRYTKQVIQKAGFEILDEDDDSVLWVDPGEPNYHTIIGSKSKLLYEYIFTSRDGALRSTNTQSANTLVQLLGVIRGDPSVMQKMPVDKYYEILNEIFRLSGTSVDLALELGPGESNTMGPSKQQQLEQTLAQIVQGMEEERQVVAVLDKKVQELTDIVQQLVRHMQGMENDIDEQSQAPQVDPMELMVNREKIRESRQRQRHAEDNHAIDNALKVVQPMLDSDLSDKRNGTGT